MEFEKLSVSVFVRSALWVIGLDWLSGRLKEISRGWEIQRLDVAANENQYYTGNELALGKPQSILSLLHHRNVKTLGGGKIQTGRSISLKI